MNSKKTRCMLRFMLILAVLLAIPVVVRSSAKDASADGSANPCAVAQEPTAPGDAALPVGPASQSLLQNATLPRVRHTALGQAQLSVADRKLRITNLGASGTDGVSIAASDTDAVDPTREPVEIPVQEFTLDIASVGAGGRTDPGASIQVRSTGSVRGCPSQPIGSLRARNLGDAVEVTVDFTPIGSASQRIEIYRSGSLVRTVSGHTALPVATVQRVAKGPEPWPRRLSHVASGPDLLTYFVLEFDAPMPISVTGNVPVEGDQLLIVAEAPTSGQVDSLLRLDVEGQDVGQLELFSKHAGDPSCYRDVIALAAGQSHSLTLKKDQTVWAVGNNAQGQLGDNSTHDSNRPVRARGLTRVHAIAAGWYHSLSVKDDGTVSTWGSNLYGQLGDGTTMDKRTPVQVGGLTGLTAVAGGYYHSLALKSDGSVWAWGRNDSGQLGDGTTVERHTPVQVSGLSNVIAVAGGAYHSLALKSDGSVWAWGGNAAGQLGDGTTADRSTPVQVSFFSNVIAVAAGMEHSFALKVDGSLWAWGKNNNGQLGDGTTTDRRTPVQVVMASGLTNVTAVAAGSYHSLAVNYDGTVWAWGGNQSGQLGDGTRTDRFTPGLVIGLTNATAVAAGDWHSLALKTDGTAWAWGDNRAGQLGDGMNTDRYQPVQMAPCKGKGEGDVDECGCCDDKTKLCKPDFDCRNGACVQDDWRQLGEICCHDAQCASKSCPPVACPGLRTCQCRINSDCADPQKFCDIGGDSPCRATRDYNTCEALRMECGCCEDSTQCGAQAGVKMTCKTHRCIVPASKNVGESCCADAQCKSTLCCGGVCWEPKTLSVDDPCLCDPQCISGSCRDFTCECLKHDDCPELQYCDTGHCLGGRNECQNLKDECGACDHDYECSSGKCKGKGVRCGHTGRCITGTENYAIGHHCCRDDQCATRSCNTDDQCQCRKDEDCPSGYYCHEGFLGIGKNSCLPLGAVGECAACTADKQCVSGWCRWLRCISGHEEYPVGHSCCRDPQCASGSCDSTDHCQCKKDGDCPSGYYCDKRGTNSCEPYTPECGGCSRDRQCAGAAKCKGGLCVTKNSVGHGGSCCHDAQCSVRRERCNNGTCSR